MSRARCLAFLAAAVATAAAIEVQAQSSGARARVVVGPNILVSNDGIVPHVEPTIAVHPLNATLLVGASIVQRETDHAVGAYASKDGGYTWSPSALPLRSAADPQLAIGRSGTVYFGALGQSDEGVGGLYVARSEDGGFTWQKPVFLDRGQDHPMIIADTSTGRFGGRVYIGSLYGGLDYRLGVFRSEDDGRTWKGPVMFADGLRKWGHNVNNVLLLSDGSVWVPFYRWTRWRPAGQPDTAYAGYATSRDGGVTFSEAKIIRVLRAGNFAAERNGRGQQFPEYAVDTRSQRHRDRIYMVFPQQGGRGNLSRLHLQYSDDRGQSWSAARQIDPSLPDDAEQFQQMVAVNKDGVVGVLWLDTRASRDRSAFDAYFAASVDGGETFLPAVRVTTDSTVPGSPGNLRIAAGAYKRGDTVYINLSKSGGRLDTGGDYMGLMADVEGTFRPLWPDARSGTYQLYTAPIRVLRGEVQVAAQGAARPSAVRRLRATEFALLFDPTSYDEATGILTVPLRVKNLTSQPLSGPITLTLELNPSLGDRGPLDTKYYPTILGAANGKTGPGAEFDLTPLAGGAAIEPGATTGSFMLRVKPTGRTDPIGFMMAFVSAGVPAP